MVDSIKIIFVWKIKYGFVFWEWGSFLRMGASNFH